MDIITESNKVSPAVDPMIPFPMKVEKFFWETEDVFSIQLAYESGDNFNFQPGQFNMLYAFGIGESAISISSDSSKKSSLIHTIHKIGYVTNQLSKLKKGDVIGVRGPFGKGWPVNEVTGKDVVLVAGGIGLAPLRPVLYHIFKNRKKYGKVTLLYGARSPQDILYPVELENWRKKHDIQIEVTVDRADNTWRGHIGVVTTLFDYIKIEPEKTISMLCGPEVMMKFTIDELRNAGLHKKDIFVSLERNMKCAVGFCGHCQYGPNFICKDGPVFNFTQVKDIFQIREL